MSDEKAIPKVKIVLLDKKVSLPHKLIDSLTKEVVELNPVGEVSTIFAEKIMSSRKGKYAKFDPNIHSDSKEGYIINKEVYRIDDLLREIKAMDVDDRDKVYELTKLIRAGVKVNIVEVVEETKATEDTDESKTTRVYQ